MPTLPGIDRIDYLVRRRFPHKADTGLDESRERPRLTRSERRQIEIYRQSLEEMEPKALAELYKDARAEEEAEHKRGEESARRFDRPDADADFAHWAQFRYWTIDEAVALSLGKDPNVVKRAEILPFVGVSEFAAAYAKRSQLLLRALFAGKEAYGIRPVDFVKWARTAPLALPEELLTTLAAAGNPMQAGAAANEAASSPQERDEEIHRLRTEIARLKSDSLSTTERRSCLTILYAMAVEKYGFGSASRHSDTATKIVSAVAAAGLSISDDTVRRWLNQASAHHAESRTNR